jgi:hypothetical protein
MQGEMFPRWILTLVFSAATAAFAQAPLCPAKPPPMTPNDALPSTRVLRRVSLALTGTTPSAARYDALLAAPADQREGIVQQAIDDALASPTFYSRMVEFGHDWIPVGAYTTGAIGDAYQGDLAGHLFTCGATTAHPGALYHVGEYASGKADNVCADKDAAGAAITPVVTMVEPWWAPGTTVTVVGKAGTATTQVPNAMGQIQDCGIATGGYYDPQLPTGCGCGPNLVWCIPLAGLIGGSTHDPNGHRRQPYEEPARLFAHLVWHDRPLSDLVTGNYSVANNMLRHLYVRMGRMTGAPQLDQDVTWWKPGVDTAPRDPEHPAAADPGAWREFTVETLDPYFLSDRSYAFDPLTTTAAPRGVPSAGVLTMIGSYSSFARERVRSARFLETFACMNFAPPPADQHFPEYSGDPATSGTCLHCHRALDPAAIFFRRWDFSPALSYYVPWPFMPGVGRHRITAAQLSGQYPYNSGPWARWRDAFKPGTVMTPITQAQITANPEAVMLDTMPSTYRLLGQQGDGTMGPLGFGKILISSGEFDKCAVRHLYERFMGRPLEPAAEARYIELLADKFRTGDRKVKPFVRYLLSLPEFRRGL